MLSTNGKGPGVFSAPGSGFDHLELRWRECQTVLPPSKHPTGPGYKWLNGEPTEPPATMTRAHLGGVSSGDSNAQPKSKMLSGSLGATDRQRLRGGGAAR